MQLILQVQNRSIPEFSGLKELKKMKLQFSKETISRIYTAFSKCLSSMQVTRPTEKLRDQGGGRSQIIWEALLEGQERKLESHLHSQTLEEMTAARGLTMEMVQKAAWWSGELNGQESTSSVNHRLQYVQKSIVFVYQQ